MSNGVHRPLRVGTHNVRTLKPDHLDTYVKLWRRQRLDVVMLQEVKSRDRLPDLRQALAGAGWHGVWGALRSPNSRRRAGVAILFSSWLWHSDCERRVWGTPLHANEPYVIGDDRFVRVMLAWGGRRLNLACAYLSADNQPARLAFIHEHIAALDDADSPVILGGDFNFTPPHMPGQAAERTQTRAPDAGLAEHEAMCGCAPTLVDAFRTLHPNTCQFTYYNNSTTAPYMARLDRFYVSQSLMNSAGVMQVGAAKHSIQPAVPTDHRLLVLTLAPRRGAVAGGGAAHERARAPPRVRMRFAGDAELVADVRARLAQLAQRAPPHPKAFAAWWSRACKPAFRMMCLRADAALWRRTRAAGSPLDSLATATAALEELLEAAEHGALDASAVDGGVEQVAAYARACAQLERHHRDALRLEVLARGEAPDASWTRAIQPPRGSGAPALLARPDGGYALAPAHIANVLAAQFASVSRAPATDAAAQNAVFATFAQGKSLLPSDVRRLDEPVNTDDEIREALKQCRALRAPGPDGIPPRFYWLFGDIVLPLLRRVFAGISQNVALPPGFRDGEIVALHKGGSRNCAGNYRPITLLNTDYRLFTRIYASRLAPVLPTFVSPCQFGFVPGRQLQDAVCTLGLSAQWHRQAGFADAWAIFCDFRKAFDTVDRGFLLALLARLGCGTSFITVVRFLLSHTRARARIGAATSAWYTFEAGVRQGCPLSPLLYNVVGEALSRFVLHTLAAKSRAAGLSQPDYMLQVPSLVQYADDVTAILRDSEAVRWFSEDIMPTFGRASGQLLNTDKTYALAACAPRSLSLIHI